MKPHPTPTRTIKRVASHVWTPPLLAQQPTWVRVTVVVVLPATSGLICGLLLHLSATAYVALTALCVAGGFTAGRDHLGWPRGARRGAVGGALFGGCLLLGHHLGAGQAQVALPNPEILQIALTAAIGTLLGAAGGASRERAWRVPSGAYN